MSDNSALYLVGMIRQRSVEEEMNDHLKSAFGGYTRKSVAEYITLLRHQQLSYAENFNQNLQSILEEKESLKNETSNLLDRISMIESEYDTLKESFENRALDEPEQPTDVIDELEKSNASLAAENAQFKTARDDHAMTITRLNQSLSEAEAKVVGVHELRNSNDTLMTDNTQLKTALSDKETIVEQQNDSLSKAEIDLANLQQELRNRDEILLREKTQTTKQRELVMQYAKSNEELKGEVRQLKVVLSEGELAKLRTKLGELTAKFTATEDIADRHKYELDAKKRENGTLSGENNVLCNGMSHIRKTLDALAEQNEKLMAQNDALSICLEEENKRIIQLIGEKSEQTVEKLKVAKQLEAATLKLSMQEKPPESTMKPVVNIPFELHAKVNSF